jgi:hypothetical protein
MPRTVTIFRFLRNPVNDSKNMLINVYKCKGTLLGKTVTLFLLSRVCVTLDGVGIGNRIYCTLIQLVTKLN